MTIPDRAMKIRAFQILFAFLPILAGMTACDPDRVYEENIALENGAWKSGFKPRFEVPLNAGTASYNVYLNIRNGREYPYSNLYLFLNTVYPDGKISRDTVELTLADYDGRWLGSGMGNLKFSRFMLRHGMRFEQAGTYAFVLEQAMRTNELKGIYDVGMRFEIAKP